MSNPIPQLGYHYYPDERHYTETDLNRWLPILDSLGANWLTLKGSFRRAIPEVFIRGLIEAEIEPIIHIPHSITHIDLESIKPIFESYTRWGVRFIIPFDQPNMRMQWDDHRWTRRNLVERFLDYSLPLFLAVKNSGLVPVLPPLEPGGDYWDTAFLQALFQSLLRRRERYLIDHLAISVYAWTYDRALDWGLGGPKLWAETRPYFRPNGSQDQVGVRIFDWYSAVAQEFSARQIPIITVGGGVNAKYSSLDEGSMVEQTLAIIRMLENGEFPATMKNFNFHLLASDPHHIEAENVWFPARDRPRAIVDAVRDYMAKLKNIEIKPLEHYILFPESMDSVAVEQFESVNEIIQQTNPVIGYSPIEAQLAGMVSLVGDESQISNSVEEELRLAGCKIQRIERALPVQEVVLQEPSEDYVQSFISRIAGENNE
jgi:hypothetical protein